MTQIMTPKTIVHELERHIIGQNDAKKAVAIALRNRWRRMQLDNEMRQESRIVAMSYCEPRS
nr:hypothetical protein [Bacillus wiedmannii]